MESKVECKSKKDKKWYDYIPISECDKDTINTPIINCSLGKNMYEFDCIVKGGTILSNKVNCTRKNKFEKGGKGMWYEDDCKEDTIVKSSKSSFPKFNISNIITSATNEPDNANVKCTSKKDSKIYNNISSTECKRGSITTPIVEVSINPMTDHFNAFESVALEKRWIIYPKKVLCTKNKNLGEGSGEYGKWYESDCIRETIVTPSPENTIPGTTFRATSNAVSSNPDSIGSTTLTPASASTPTSSITATIPGTTSTPSASNQYIQNDVFNFSNISSQYKEVKNQNNLMDDRIAELKDNNTLNDTNAGYIVSDVDKIKYMNIYLFYIYYISIVLVLVVLFMYKPFNFVITLIIMILVLLYPLYIISLEFFVYNIANYIFSLISGIIYKPL